MAFLSFPNQELLSRRWQCERAIAWFLPVAAGVCVAVFASGIVLFFLAESLIVIKAVFAGLLITWLAAMGVLLRRFFKKKSHPNALAKRADRVLGLPDDLLNLADGANGNVSWQQAALRKSEERLALFELKRDWPLRLSRAALSTTVFAVVLTAAVSWLGGIRLAEARQKLAKQHAAQETRVAAVEDVLKDWKDFVQLTDDEELKKLFTEAAQLKEAVEKKDPMAAMLEMNRIEEKMNALQATVEKNSLASQAAKMAEALEAFEGMGAMSAALRNKNFPAAEKEAGKLGEKLAANPEGKTNLSRKEVAAEMLAAESKKASEKGNKNLSQALSQMSQAAKESKDSQSVPNNQLTSSTQSLKDEFRQESARQNRGRTAATAKSQLDALRNRLRGEQPGSIAGNLPSLCKMPGVGGKEAGTSTDGTPQGETTELASAAVEESVTGTKGEGESETRTLSSATGSESGTTGAKKTTLSEYVELSQKAVDDENLPLAHRQVIRHYFESIRPVTENTVP